MKKKDLLFFIVVVMLLVVYFEDYVESDKAAPFSERVAFEPPTKMEGVWKLVELVRGCGDGPVGKLAGNYMVFRGSKSVSYSHTKDGQVSFVSELTYSIRPDGTFVPQESRGFYFEGSDRKDFHVIRATGVVRFEREKDTARITSNEGLTTGKAGVELYECPEGETMEYLLQRLSYQ